ncbi:MAG: sigma-70 family RNA polymerase sigma factor [Pedobacter sp.]|nr:MAG: sigma-70 family RNA polymerase sigma factor [Pedobacter sp.]
MTGNSYKEAAEQLGMSVEAVSKAVSRLRGKLRDCLRGQIAGTLRHPDAAQVDGELAALKATLRW